MNIDELIRCTIYLTKELGSNSSIIDEVEKSLKLLKSADKSDRDEGTKLFNSIDTEISLYNYEIRRNCQIILSNTWILNKTYSINLDTIVRIYNNTFSMEKYLENMRGEIVKKLIMKGECK